MPWARGVCEGARRLIRAGEGTPVVGWREGAAGCTKERSPSLLEAAGPTDVGLDLDTGVRAHRGRTALAALREKVPSAGAVHVVNNGAVALVRGATAPAPGREIVISRGEMVEIGDSFRLPELLVSTGARLREVGTTNVGHD